MLSFELLHWLSAILKLDFLKSPGKSGSARPPARYEINQRFGHWKAMPLFYSPDLETQGRGRGLEPGWGWDLSIFLKNAVLGLGKTAFF